MICLVLFMCTLTISSSVLCVFMVEGMSVVVNVMLFLMMCVCVWLRWCRWGVGRGFGPGSGKVGWCYVCVSCESGFFV